MLPKNSRRLLLASVVLTICAAAGGVAAYLRAAAAVPVYPPPSVKLPERNGYFELADTGALIPGGVHNPGDFDALSPAELRSLVISNRDALKAARAAFGLDFVVPPLTSSPQGFPELSRLRQLAMAILAEGKLAEREGRLPDAARSYIDVVRLGEKLSHGSIPIHVMIANWMTENGLRGLQPLAPRLDQESATESLRELVSLEARYPRAAECLANMRESEVRSVADILRRTHSWQEIVAGSGRPRANPAQEAWTALTFAFTPRRKALMSLEGYLDRVIADARQPFYRSPPRPRIPDDPLSSLRRQELFLLADTGLRFAWRDAQLRITEVRLAARAYELRHGRPAVSAAELAAGFFTAPPQDPFAPQPLVYRLVPGGFVTYSVGPDGVDDGGRKDLGSRVDERGKGDIVSLGPELRRASRAYSRLLRSRRKS